MKTITVHEIRINHPEIRTQFWEDVESGKWEPQTFNVFDKYIEKGKVFIDIGAWNGVCSLYAAKKGAVCYAIEPDDAIWSELKQNIECNNFRDQIQHVPICIADMDGSFLLTSMTTDGFGNSESSLINRGEFGAEKHVIGLTLETFVNKYDDGLANVCLIKIDVEGSEVLILSQAKEFISIHRPTIYISFHPAWFPNFDEDVRMISETIFPIYDILGMNGNRYSIAEFYNAMHTNHDHSFILIKKA